MAERKSAEQVKDDRATRSQKNSEAAHKQNEPAVKAREDRDKAVREVAEEEREARLAAAEEETEAEEPKKVHKLTGKPGSGAGLRPGDWIAPSSNPGAAARIPTQPLQPEALQSHGKGILHDKDLDNPPYDLGDPVVTDEGPSGSGSPSNLSHARTVDKAAERKKAESLSPRGRSLDPDNSTVGAGGVGDATASPKPIGTRGGKKNSRSGGSNPGI